jgi:hypothetical protein
MRIAGARPGQAGASAVEFAIALPVLLLLGLGALQWALVFHARQAIEHAAIEAARSGSVGHALQESIDRGLARGLLPFWAAWSGVRQAGGDRDRAVEAALERLRRARTDGWIVLRRLDPGDGAFADWGEETLDGWGRAIPGSREIPNDNLMFAEQRTPAGGSAVIRDGLAVGPRSGQTLVEANRLRLEIVYGVPMTVPFVGRLAAQVGRLSGGCMPVELGGCLIHQAGESGRSATAQVPRWPVRVSATVRMQSAARVPGAALSAVGASTGRLPARGPASRPPDADGESATAGQGVTAHQPSSGASGENARSGALSFGADRLFSVPGACMGA